MSNMSIILPLSGYTIYKNKSYYLCIPHEDSNFYHLFMSFTDKDLTKLSQDDLVMEIRRIGDSVNASYKNGIYLLPIISPTVLEEATLENDDRQYNYILNTFIQPITSDVYKWFSKRKKNVSQTIKMIKQNDMDKKLVGWLSMKLGNEFIKEILFEVNEEVSTVPTDVLEDVFHTSNVQTIFIDYKDDIQVKDENYISDTLKPAFSPGFSKLGFIIMVLTISLILGVILGYMILK